MNSSTQVSSKETGTGNSTGNSAMQQSDLRLVIEPIGLDARPC
jgi:hypothetical protein